MSAKSMLSTAVINLKGGPNKEIFGRYDRGRFTWEGNPEPVTVGG